MTVKRTTRAKPEQPGWIRLFFRRLMTHPVLLLCAVLTLAALSWIFVLSQDLPSLEQLENVSPELATRVYSADGILIKEFFTERRSYTPLSRMPDNVVNAVLATEDHRFYEHWGIVPLRLFKVIITDLLTLSKQQGASTLTQQLARRLYLTPEKTIPRKIKEIMAAIQIERTYTKPEILEMYLNQMSFGHGTYGVTSAAKHFFGKTIHELTLAECALITGMLQRPATLNPYKYPDRAIRRRDLVLRRMLAHGVIKPEQYETAKAEQLVLIPQADIGENDVAPYFTEYVRQNLWEKYGWDLFKGGMKIYTTLDSRVQTCAETAVAHHLPVLQDKVRATMSKRTNLIKIVPPSLLQKMTYEQILVDKVLVDSLIDSRCIVQVALVAIDPRNGHILAMVGGRDFRESQFNRAVQAIRQPGSVFKPFVYTAAIDNGFMPFHEKLNQPEVVLMPDGSRWTPHNYDGSIGGKTTLREALRKSLNLVTVRLVREDVPPEQVIKYARYLGISTPLDPVDAIALGASGVIPLEIVSAFGAFANHGVLVDPTSVLRVEDKFGNIVERAVPNSKGVLREETAYIITNMLQTVAWSGTGAASVSVHRFTRPAAGKTGTTNDFTDAWYISFTPQLVAGVWVGLDDPSLSLGDRQSGARAALPITAPFMKAAHDTLHLPVADFVRPEGVVDVEICRETKMLASEACPDVLREICDYRSIPSTVCDLHTGSPSEGAPQRANRRRIIY